MRMLTIGCALLALSACHPAAKQAQKEPEASEPGGSAKGPDPSHRGEEMPNVVFNDPTGRATSLAAFKGKPTLVNLWASWCGPCVKELPTLDLLQQRSAGKLSVVAISQDDAPHTSVEAFLAKHNVRTLKAYQDDKMALSAALRADVLPTSILYDAEGKEVWRYVGDLDWTGPEAARLISRAGAR